MAVSPTLLEEEINWYKDRLLFGLEDYLAADRSGRGFALLPAMRERVYQAMLLYHQRLREENRMDWEDVPRYLWREMQANPAHRVALYDFILIDEAQFFAPLWYEIIKQRLHPTGHLFLVADPSQGFLKRGQSWLSTSGLEVRGRVQQLRQSYRTTHQILDFATWFYQTRLPDDLEIVPPDLTNMPVGAVPLWLVSTSKQDETTRLINEIRALLQAGHDLGQILIIHPHVQEVKGITRRLKHAFGEEQVVDPRHEAGHGRLRICPLNAATGLESPIVFLLGINELYEREGAVDLTEAERQELVRDNTRRLYMAMTRAGQRLVLSYVGELPPSLRQL
jgi:superfamily I DNA/RNA helicase